uniref:Plexin domain-containing protein 1 n=1 Tax=Cacopsylla melanoneura TaxID=428564 RepID=A0A8D9DMN6_9HEMI
MIRTNLCLLCACFVISRAVSSDINNEHNNTRDNQQYYEISFNRDEKTVRELWLEMNDENCVTYSFMEALEAAKLSNEKYMTYQTRLMQNLLFNFPLYSETVHSVKIDEQGGIFIIKEFSTKRMEKVTNIAPFYYRNQTKNHPMLSSFIRVVSNDSQFTVSWKMSGWINGSTKFDFLDTLEFQATLHKTGDIVFVYKSIPYYNNQRFIVGLFNGFTTENNIFEYNHSYLILSETNISTWTSIQLKHIPYVNLFETNISNSTSIHLPTCWNHKNCTECLSDPTMSHLNCSWCPSANLCSMEVDKNHPKWKLNNCNREAITEAQLCSISTEDKIENKTILIGVIIFLSVCLGIVLIKFILREKKTVVTTIPIMTPIMTPHKEDAKRSIPTAYCQEIPSAKRYLSPIPSSKTEKATTTKITILNIPSDQRSPVSNDYDQPRVPLERGFRTVSSVPGQYGK